MSKQSRESAARRELTDADVITVIDALNDAIMLNEGAIEGATLSQGQPPFTPEETEDLADELERLPRFKELLTKLGRGSDV